jgi:hypothetical protein
MVEHRNKILYRFSKVIHLLFHALWAIGTIEVLAGKCQQELPLAL